MKLVYDATGNWLEGGKMGFRGKIVSCLGPLSHAGYSYVPTLASLSSSGPYAPWVMGWHIPASSSFSRYCFSLRWKLMDISLCLGY